MWKDPYISDNININTTELRNRLVASDTSVGRGRRKNISSEYYSRGLVQNTVSVPWCFSNSHAQDTTAL